MDSAALGDCHGQTGRKGGGEVATRVGAGWERRPRMVLLSPLQRLPFDINVNT